MAAARLLDLFCGAGGAAVGYARAGFAEILGVDIKRQKRYPFGFVQADAIEFCRAHGAEFDAIHASPPCQAYSTLRHLEKAQAFAAFDYSPAIDRPELIEPTRSALRATGKPYVIENVIGAPLWPAARLCGSSFGLKVRRHRVFESSLVLMSSTCRHEQQGTPLAVYGHSRGKKSGQKKRPRRGPHDIRWFACPCNVAEAREAMGIDWMTWNELTQAIPPAYTEWIGRQLVQALR